MQKPLINKGHKTAYLWVFESNGKAIRFYERLGGVQKEQALKTVFGYKVLSRKIEWHDLSVICEDQQIYIRPTTEEDPSSLLGAKPR